MDEKIIQQGGWDRYQALVLSALKEHSKEFRDLTTKLEDIQVRVAENSNHTEAIRILQEQQGLMREKIASLEVRASVIGGAAGFLAALLGSGLLALLMQFVKGGG